MIDVRSLMSIMYLHIQMKALSFLRMLPACQTWELIFSAPIRVIGRSSHFQEQPPAPGKNTDGETMRREGYDILPFVTKI